MNDGKLGDTQPVEGRAVLMMRLGSGVIGMVVTSVEEGLGLDDVFSTVAAAVASSIYNVGTLGASREEVRALFEKTFAEFFERQQS